MKILMIIPRLAGGGAERVVSNLSMQFNNSKYGMDMLLDYNDIEYPYLGKVIILNRDFKAATSIRNEFLTYIRKAALLYKMKKNHMYDCYISHSDVSHILNIITGRKNCKMILVQHSQRANVQRSKISRIIVFFAKKYYQRADHIIAVSQGIAKECTEEYSIDREKITTIWNGSDLQRIKEAIRAPINEEQSRWLATGKIVITMGRYVSSKGHIHLIRAFSRVVKRYPDSKLLLLGDGELRGIYEKTIEILHLENNVILCGFQNNPFALLGRSDVFVFPSKWEGFGYALEEAICCGIPCISTDFKYGAREILRYNGEEILKDAVYTKYGVLIPVCNGEVGDSIACNSEEEIMAEAIIKVLEDKEYQKKIIENNSNRLYEFSLECMVARWSEALGR